MQQTKATAAPPSAAFSAQAPGNNVCEMNAIIIRSLMWWIGGSQWTMSSSEADTKGCPHATQLETGAATVFGDKDGKSAYQRHGTSGHWPGRQEMNVSIAVCRNVAWKGIRRNIMKDERDRPSSAAAEKQRDDDWRTCYRPPPRADPWPYFVIIFPNEMRLLPAAVQWWAGIVTKSNVGSITSWCLSLSRNHLFRCYENKMENKWWLLF